MNRKGRISEKERGEKRSRPERLVEVDLLKACAILAVILIHTLFTPILLLIGAPFHIWHAVPLFILIAGYTSAYAYMRRGSKTLDACYDPRLIYRRIRRIIEPFAVMWVFQVLAIIILSGWIFTSSSLVQNFLFGGNGPGSYYIPVIIQHVLIIPLIFLLALRYPRGMVILTFVLDILFELFMYLSGISSGIYAVLYVRYLFAGALGVYLAVSGPRFTRWTAVGGIVGFVYLALTTYLGLFSNILRSNIEGGISHAPAYFWTIVLAVTGFILFPNKVTTGSVKIFEMIGRSSWHIFLVQMTFFYFSWQWVQLQFLLPLQQLMPRSIDFLVIPVGALLTITLCCSVGCIWYASGEYLQKILSKTPINPE